MDTSAQVRRRPEGVNIPTLERIVTTGIGLVGAGVGITAAILGPRHVAAIGSAVAVIGVALAGRGLGGRCPAYRRRARREDAAAHGDDGGAQLHGAGTATRQGVRDLDRDVPGRKNQGEGDRRSSRAYNEHVRDFIDDDRVEPAARAAAAAVDGPEGASLRRAEEAGKAPINKPGPI